MAGNERKYTCFDIKFVLHCPANFWHLIAWDKGMFVKFTKKSIATAERF